MARKRSPGRNVAGAADDVARLAVAGVFVLILTGTAGTALSSVRAWLSIWWPLLAMAALALVTLACWRLRVLRARGRARAARQAELDRHVATTDSMNGTQFEHLVARLLRRDGWRDVHVTGGSGDLGADVTARHPGDGSLLVVQCKRYSGRAVSSPDLQRFLGTVFHHHRADHALYVTTSYYSRPAHQLASSNGVQLLDRQALANWMTGKPLPLTRRAAGTS